eukprot:6191085-Pleurochrysis_carterae.AAC.2
MFGHRAGRNVAVVLRHLLSNDTDPPRLRRRHHCTLTHPSAAISTTTAFDRINSRSLLSGLSSRADSGRAARRRTLHAAAVVRFYGLKQEALT